MISSETKMDVLRVYLLFVVYLVSDSTCYIETVDFFGICGNGYGYDRSMPNTKRFSVTMYGYDWPYGLTYCTVIFKSIQAKTDLAITFNSFHLSDIGTDIKIESKSSSFYRSMAEYSKFLPPRLGSTMEIFTYLKVTATRRTTSDVSLAATFDVNTVEFNNRSTQPISTKSQYTSTDFGSGWHFTLGRIIGVVVGAIVAITIATIVVGCWVSKSRRRANTGVVMATSNQNATTTSTVLPVLYPQQALQEQFAMHPTYSLAQPPRYPVQSIPPDYSAPPPPYSSVVANGNANPVSQGKI